MKVVSCFVARTYQEFDYFLGSPDVSEAGSFRSKLFLITQPWHGAFLESPHFFHLLLFTRDYLSLPDILD